LQAKLVEQDKKTPSDLEAIKVTLLQAHQELSTTQDSLLQERGKALQLETKLSKTEKQLNAFKQSAANDSVRHLKEVTDLKSTVELLTKQQSAQSVVAVSSVESVQPQQTNEKFLGEIEDLKKENEGLLKLKNEVDIERDGYKKLSEESLAVKNDAAKERDNLKHVNEELLKSLSEVAMEIDNCTKKNQELLKSLSEAAKERDDYKKINEEVLKLKSDVEIECASLKKLSEELQKSNNDITNERESLKKNNEELLKSRNDVIKEYDNLKKANEESLALKTEIDSYKKRNEEMQISLSVITKESDRFKRVNEELLAISRSHEHTLKTLEDQIVEASNKECKECNQWKDQCKSLEDSAQDWESKYKSSLNQLDEQKNTNVQLNNQLQEQQSVVQQLNSDNKHQSEKLRDFEKTNLEALQLQKQEFESQRNSNQTLLAQIEELKTRLSTENKDVLGQALIAERRCEILQAELSKKEEDAKDTKQKLTETIDKYVKECEASRETKHLLSTKELECKITKDDLIACEALLESEKQSNLKLMEKIKEDRSLISQLKEQHHKLTKLCEDSQNNSENNQNRFQDEKKHLAKELEILQEQYNKERANYVFTFKQMQQDKLSTELATIESLKNQIIELKKVYSIQLQLVDSKDQ
jgi:chromosome segregation ATPase